MYNITVCFSASEEWYGKAIRSITKSTVNHAFLEFGSNDWQTTQAIQIDQRGIVQLPANKVKYKSVRRFRPKRNGDEKLARGLKNCNGMVGRKYDWLGIFGFLVKLVIWYIFFKKIGNPWHKANQMFCSEFVTTVLQKSGFREVAHLNPADVHPGFLMLLLERSDDWEEVFY